MSHRGLVCAERARHAVTQAVKQLSGMVAEMAHLITGAAFNPFLRSNQEKCSSLWSAFERLHMSVISDIRDLIDASYM